MRVTLAGGCELTTEGGGSCLDDGCRIPAPRPSVASPMISGAVLQTYQSTSGVGSDFTGARPHLDAGQGEAEHTTRVILRLRVSSKATC